MSAQDLAAPRRRGLGTMVAIVWRTHRRGILVWVIALAASMIGTAAAVAGLYDTPAKIHTYAEAVTSGSALAAINGHVEGIDSLGGVIQDEFGFLASFLLPLLGIGLIAGSTRREEESGRLETILGGRIARHQPALAALVVATAAILVTAVLFAAGLIVFGSPVVAAPILYGAALGALAFVFAGFAALLAQLVSARPRGLHVEPDRAGRGVRPARGRRHHRQLVDLAVPAGLGGEDGTVRGPAVVGARRPGRRRPRLGGCGRVAGRSPRRRQRSAAGRRGSGASRPGSGDGRSASPPGSTGPATAGWLAGGDPAHRDDGLAGPAVPRRDGRQSRAGARPWASKVGGRWTASSPRPSSTWRSSAPGTSSRRSAPCAPRRPRAAWRPGSPARCPGSAGWRRTASSSRPGWCSSSSARRWSSRCRRRGRSGTPTSSAPIMRAGVDYLPAELVFAGLALALFGLWPRAFGRRLGGVRRRDLHRLPRPRPEARAVGARPCSHHARREPSAGNGRCRHLAALTVVAVALVLVGFIAFRRRDVPRV